MNLKERSLPRRRGGLLAVLFAMTALSLAPGSGPHVATLAGSVEIGSGAPLAWRVANVGDPIAPGDAIRTGHDGRAELVLGTGTVRLYANSLLRVPLLGSGDGASERVRLEKGRSLFDVLKRRNGRFDVETPEVVVSVKGTRFGVDVTAALAQVAVYRGRVGVRELSQALAMETLVREGFAAIGGTDAPFELLLNGADDPWDGFPTGRVMPLLENRALLQGGMGSLDPLALHAMTPPPSEAVTEARLAARDATRGEVVAIAMERNPVLRDRVEQIRRKAERETPGLDLPTEAIEREVTKTVAAPADLAPARDAVADSSAFRHEIRAAMIESIVSGAPIGSTSGGAGGSGAGPFTIAFVPGALGDQVVITAGGASYAFDQTEVLALGVGSTTLPTQLMSYLTMSGISGSELQLIFDQMTTLFTMN